MSLCENNCSFTEYDTNTKSAKCECNVKSKEFLISEIINQTDILSYNFTSKEESSTNMITMKWYYTLFTKDGLAKNIGSYILLIIIFLFICLGILFYKCGYPLLEDMIKEIINIKNKKQNDLDINRKDTTDNKIIKKRKTKKSNKKNTNLKKIKTKGSHNTKKYNTKIIIPENNKKNQMNNIKKSFNEKNNKKKEKNSKVKGLKKRNKKHIKLKDINSNKINRIKTNSNSIVQLQFQNKDKIIQSKDLSNYYDYDLIINKNIVLNIFF